MNIKQVEERKEKLEQAKINLKKHFVGIDDIIDRFIQSIETWYIMPELQNRPTIVNLWGPTGVGKTDLVRRLVKELHFSDFFSEVQMDCVSEHKPLSSFITSSNITYDTPGIVLLDEFQRFKSINEKGMTYENMSGQDTWMLLSDGKFADDSHFRREITNLYLEQLYDEDYSEAKKRQNKYEKEEETKTECEPKSENKPTTVSSKNEVNAMPEPKPVTHKYHNSTWWASRVKQVLGIATPIQEIMTWDSQRLLTEAEARSKALENDEINTTYKQLLVIVCGNLDDTFHMSNTVDTQIDADVYHAWTKKITVGQVKSSLVKLFKPEQVARLGNTHIIYPILDTAAYKKLIDVQLTKIAERIDKEYGVLLSFEPELKTAIYRNGVQPAQGVRPIFTTINNIVECSLPKILLSAKTAGASTVTLSIKSSTECLVYKIKDEWDSISIRLEEDRRINLENKNEYDYVVVHECGHALVESILTKTAPAQLLAYCNRTGFTVNVLNDGTRDKILDAICASLAGRAAEEHVFDTTCSGDGPDLAYATDMAFRCSADWGFCDDIAQKAVVPNADGAGYRRQVPEDINADIKNIVDAQHRRACSLLTEHTTAFKALIMALRKKRVMFAKDIAKVLNEAEPELSIRCDIDKVTVNSTEMLNDYLA